MKLIDRYVAVSFLKDYLISFLVLVGMRVVLDMVLNLDELVEVTGKTDLSGLPLLLEFARYVGDFYAHQMFLYFVELSGVIPVVAASFTLMRMVRFNELSALLSAGVPLLRVAMPIILTSLVLNGVLWVDQEMVIPRIIPKLIRSHDWGSDTDGHAWTISAMRDDRGGKLFASRYYPLEQPPRMEHLSVVVVDERNRPICHIRADEAVWEAKLGAWRLSGGRMDRNLLPGLREPVRSEKIEYYQSSITPEKIHLFQSTDFVDLLSTSRINELLQSETYARAELLRVKHTRGPAQILLNMVLLLLAIGSILTRDPQRLIWAAAKCVLLCLGCTLVAVAGQKLAGQPPLLANLAGQWPALMAWLPVFTFGPLSIVLLDRVKS